MGTHYILKNEFGQVQLVTRNCGQAWVRRGNNVNWTIETRENLQHQFDTRCARRFANR